MASACSIGLATTRKGDVVAPGGFKPNALNVQDIASFVAPTRRINTSLGNPNFNVRWDLIPGSMFGETINLQDMAALTSGSPTANPPMFNGQRGLPD